MKYVIAIYALLVFASCDRGSSDLESAIRHQFETGSKTIDLSNISTEDYDRVCILTPYTSGSRARECLGFDWQDFGSTGIEMHDTFNTIVLLNGNAVVAWTNFGRGSGKDFYKVAKNCCYARAEAQFTF